MSTERDSHFAGFAKLLYEDFLQLQREDESSIQEMLAPDSDYPDKWRAKVEQRITQRAYDLTMYILQMVPQLMNVVPNAHSLPEVIAFLPDMDTWPE